MHCNVQSGSRCSEGGVYLTALMMKPCAARASPHARRAHLHGGGTAECSRESVESCMILATTYCYMRSLVHEIHVLRCFRFGFRSFPFARRVCTVPQISQCANLLEETRKTIAVNMDPRNGQPPASTPPPRRCRSPARDPLPLDFSPAPSATMTLRPTRARSPMATCDSHARHWPGVGPCS